MSPDMEVALTKFLCDNIDIFMWKPSDMPSIPCGIARHRLNRKADAKPVRQHLRRFNKEKRKAIGEELARLRAAGFIREVQHPDWLYDRTAQFIQDQVRLSPLTC